MKLAMSLLVSTLSVAVLLLIGGAMSGCAAAAYTMVLLKPPEKIPPLYVPSTRPTAVLVESYRVKGNVLGVRDSLAGFISAELEKNKVAEMVPTHRVYDLRTSDHRAFRALTVDQIGRKVGAEQVIYVDVLEARVVESVGNQVVAGRVSAQVKVVEVATGRTLFPSGLEEGHLVSVETPFARTDDLTTPERVKEALCRTAASQIARLFYTYTVPE